MEHEAHLLLWDIWPRCSDRFAPGEQLVERLAPEPVTGAPPELDILLVMLERIAHEAGSQFCFGSRALRLLVLLHHGRSIAPRICYDRACDEAGREWFASYTYAG